MSAIVTKDGITPGIQDLATNFPKEYAKALMDLGSRWRRIMAEQFKAGNPGGEQFAPLNPLTLKLRQQSLAGVRAKRRALRARGVSAKAPEAKALTRRRSELTGFGGRIPALDRYAINNGTLRVGWLGDVVAGSDRSVARYQPQENRAFTKAERRLLHVVLQSQSIPSDYRRPQRAPVQPQYDNFRADAFTALTKSIKRRLEAAAAKAGK